MSAAVARRAARAAVVVVVTVAATFVAPSHAHAETVRLEAENAIWGGVCGDGQAQAAEYDGVFLGGAGCTVVFGPADVLVVRALRWFGGGWAGPICGFWTIESSEGVFPSDRTCSMGGALEYVIAPFPAAVAVAGTFAVTWHPDVFWWDANLDWVEAESTRAIDGACRAVSIGDTEAPTRNTVVVEADTIATGQTPVLQVDVTCVVSVNGVVQFTVSAGLLGPAVTTTRVSSVPLGHVTVCSVHTAQWFDGGQRVKGGPC